MYSHYEPLKVIKIILETYPLERQIIGGVSSLVIEAFWIPTLMHSWRVSIDRKMPPVKREQWRYAREKGEAARGLWPPLVVLFGLR